MVTLQNAELALKEYYLDAFKTQMDGDLSPFFNAIEKTTANVSGKGINLAIVNETQGSIAALPEDGDLPSPYANRYYNIVMPLKNIYGTIEISDKAIRGSRDSAGGIVNLLDAEMEGLVHSAKTNFARMLFGNGKGYLCKLVSVVSPYAFTVDVIKNYYQGMKINIMSGNTIIYEGAQVVALDLENKMVGIDMSISASNLTGDCGIYVSGALNNELCGLAAIFDNTELYGYKKSLNLYFTPAVWNVSSDTFSESDLVTYIDRLDAVYDSKINMILCSHTRRKQIAEMLADRRRLVNTTDIAAGFSSVVVNDVPVYADKFCPDDTIYLLNTNDFTLCQLCDWEWLEDEDGKILKQIPGKAAYRATIVKYAELICKRPCGQGAIKLS